MDYEKKYKEALERARKLWNEAKANEYTSDIEDYETIFPELAESEDERVRNWLVISVNNMADCWFADDAITREIVLAWLEKQKENPKTAISIPADCASNAKCPYKTHGDGDFDEYIKDTPAYYFGFDDGVRSEREKQKEQKPAEWMKERMMKDAIDYRVVNNLAAFPVIYYELNRNEFKYGDKVKLIIIKEN